LPAPYPRHSEHGDCDDVHRGCERGTRELLISTPASSLGLMPGKRLPSILLAGLRVPRTKRARRFSVTL
jgi:hypothetical protein